MERAPERRYVACDAVTSRVEQATAAVAGAERIAVLAGAGISTDSGIPDFRGPNGVWTQDPAAEKRATIDHYIASREARQASWERLASRGSDGRQPNAGHLALLELERSGRLLRLVTQNVDGLHHAAGHDPARITEVHGNLREVKCLSCGRRWPVAVVLARVEHGEDDPACEVCGGILKAAVVSFGEGLDPADIAACEQAAIECDLLLAVGTTLGVYPVAAMVPLAAQRGATVIIVNAEPTEMDGLADIVVADSLSDALPVICGGLSR